METDLFTTLTSKINIIIIIIIIIIRKDLKTRRK